jgi:serine protease DegQ
MYNLPSDHGLLILNLVDAGPADREGVRSGDIILEMSGRKILDQTEAERELSKLKPDEGTTLTLQRGPRTLKIKVKLDEFPPQLNRVREGVL